MSSTQAANSSPLDQLPWLQFKQIFEEAEYNPALTEVNSECRKLFKQSLEGFWNTLKQDLPPGHINLQEHMTTIEAEHSDHFDHFQKLQEAFTRETVQIPKNIFPCTSAHYEELQTRLHKIYEAKALVACWPKIKAAISVHQQPQLNETSADEIRAWMNDNAPILNTVTILNLSGLELKVIPQEITKLSQLQELYLHNNQISAIPEGIRALTGLRELSLHNNQISAIPDAIQALTGLQYLCLNSNQISAIPEGIRALTGLRELYLNNNQISAIPDAIQALTGLQRLYLSNNQISAIPESIRDLTGLQRLCLHNNQISAIPEGIRALIGLELLSLSNNQISAIPDAIQALTGLERLYLSDNQISAIPDAIQALTGLQELSLDNNQISAIPEGIRALTQLLRLSLSHNRISAIPEGIQALTQLLRLFVSNNQISFIPGCVLDMTDLEMFDIHGNPIPSLDVDCLYFEKLLSKEKTINYKKELTHPSSSPLAQLYQTIIRGRPENEMWAALHQLTQNDRNWIFERLWRFADCPLDDTQWGENHAFDNLSHLYLAVRERILLQFEGMSEERKNLAYGRICELAGRPDTQDLEWGRNHALDNLPRLSDAVASST